MFETGRLSCICFLRRTVFVLVKREDRFYYSLRRPLLLYFHIAAPLVFFLLICYYGLWAIYCEGAGFPPGGDRDLFRRPQQHNLLDSLDESEVMKLSDH